MMSARIGIVILLCAQLGCVITETAYEKDGKLYGVVDGAFRGRWYNYFERGTSFAAGGYCDKAIADFDVAITLRPDDQRRARTYGLHFVDYFPHRERGICLLEQGKIDDAMASLQTSLASVDSGRGEYYLNETVRRQLLARGVKDDEAPFIDSAAVSGLVRGSSFRLKGTIKDPSRVLAVSVNGRPVLLPIAVDSYALDIELPLEPGNNEIVIKAWDLFRNSSEKRFTLKLDEQPPAIAVQEVIEHRGQQILIGSIQDESGIASLLADKSKVAVSAKPGRIVGLRIPVSSDQVVLRAEDRAGNVAEIKVDVAELRVVAAEKDTAPPVIEVAKTPAVVFTDRVFLDGKVSDRSSVDILEVANESIPGTGQRTVYFRRVVRLKEGENIISLRALDDHGQMSEAYVKILRKVPAARALQNRLSVTMAPFVPTGEQTEGIAVVEQNLENAIVEQQRFHLLDRSRVQSLVTEWQLVATDLAKDGPDLLRLGEVLSSDVTLMGWVNEGPVSIEVYGRLVDSQTGAVMLEKDVFHEKKSLRNVRDLLFGLGLKLKAALPTLEGKLTVADGEQLQIEMENAGLLPAGAHLLLVGAPGADGPYGSDQLVLGQARIEEIGDGLLRARLINGTAAANVAVLTK